MIQEDLPTWPDPSVFAEDDYVVPYETLLKLGRGDAAAGRRLLRTLIDIEIVHEPINGPTPKPENVRLATINDEASLVELLRLDVTENAAHIAAGDDAALFDFVQAATRDIHNLGSTKPIIGVIGSPDRIEGAIFIELNRWFWSSNSWFLQEKLTAVRPDCRKSRHATDLLKFARWFSDAMSESAGFRVYLLASVVASRDVNRKIMLFSRLMNKAGGVFAYPSPSIVDPNRDGHQWRNRHA